MKTCKDCKWYKSCMDICELSPQNCFVFKQRTNFDKVTVSPKALAEFVNKAIDLAIYHEQCFITPCNNEDCVECTTRWLNQEAEEETKNDKP